jgi:hypothetical protein
MMCVVTMKRKPTIYGTLIEKNKCMRTDIRFENGLMYLYPTLHSNEYLLALHTKNTRGGLSYHVPTNVSVKKRFNLRH